MFASLLVVWGDFILLLSFNSRSIFPFCHPFFYLIFISCFLFLLLPYLLRPVRNTYLFKVGGGGV